MRRSKHERELMKQRQKFCEKKCEKTYIGKQNLAEYIINLGEFFKNKITNYTYKCDCSYCLKSKLRKQKQSDLNFKEQRKDLEG